MSTPNMGLTLPTDHGSADTWDTILDAVFALIDAHDHTTGKGVKVPSSGLNMNADLSFANSGTPVGVTNAKTVDFAAVATSTMTSYAGALFVNSADSELYYRTIAGVNVKFTSGAALNVAAFTGGIGGDYAAVGALESFDDATDSYWLQQQGSPRPWAGLRVGNVDIYQQAASIATRVRLQSPNALAASYALTLPAALPAAQALAQVDAAGVMTLTNTLGNNLNLKLQGTGYIQRGANVGYSYPALPGTLFANGGTATQTAGQPGLTVAASSNIWFPVSIGIGLGERVTKVVFGWSSTGTAATLTLNYDSQGTGWQNIPITITNVGFIYTLTVNTPVTIASTGPVYVKFATIAASTAVVYNFQTFTDVP